MVASVIPATVSQYFPVTHYMLRPDYLERDDMVLIKKAMTQNNAQVRAIDYAQLRREFSLSQIYLYCLSIGIPYEEIEECFARLVRPLFIPTGTASYFGPEYNEKISRQQVAMIHNVIHPQGMLHKYLEGENYEVIVKLHPAGYENNNVMSTLFSQYIKIPEWIGYEILTLYNLLPHKTAGFISSLYFTLPKENIAFLVATIEKEKALQDPLIQVMKELDIITDSSLYFFSDLFELYL